MRRQPNISGTQTNDNHGTTFEPCPLWIRIFCILYDLFFVSSILIILGFVLLPTLHQLGYSDLPKELFTIYYLFWIVFYYLYFWKKGQTLGMLIWRLHYLNTYSQRSYTHFKQILLRMFLSFIALPGLVFCLFNKDKKSLVDMICCCKLVRHTKKTSSST